MTVDLKALRRTAKDEAPRDGYVKLSAEAVLELCRLAEIGERKTRRLSDEEVEAWRERHFTMGMNVTDLRCAIDDAASLVFTEPPK